MHGRDKATITMKKKKREIDRIMAFYELCISSESRDSRNKAAE